MVTGCHGYVHARGYDKDLFSFCGYSVAVEQVLYGGSPCEVWQACGWYCYPEDIIRHRALPLAQVHLRV